jgi:actin-like ATPase involved in cell morphogenesis
MYAGIDLGTTFIKTHTGLVFPSGISEKYTELSTNVMTVGEKTYAMELNHEKSNYGINIDKYKNENIRANFIYALYRIGMSDKMIYRNVVVGLPASQWEINDIVEKYKELLAVPEFTPVIVNNIPAEIRVDNICVVPECASAYYAMDYEQFESMKTLIIDIGGLTINQSLFSNNELMELTTDEDGVLHIYQEMAAEINKHMKSNISLEGMYEIITKGMYHKGMPIDVGAYIDRIADSYCERIYRKLKLKWDVDNIKYVLLIGAGSITMEKYLRKYIPQATLMEDAQFLNARGMYEIAKECIA